MDREYIYTKREREKEIERATRVCEREKQEKGDTHRPAGHRALWTTPCGGAYRWRPTLASNLRKNCQEKKAKVRSLDLIEKISCTRRANEEPTEPGSLRK